MRLRVDVERALVAPVMTQEASPGTPDNWRDDGWKAAVERFERDHPGQVALLLMRFDDTKVMEALRLAILDAMRRHGYEVVRADDCDYTGELWRNVELCMHCSQLVICVLEDIERRDCDANVMVELGYALGLNLRTLLLVERRLPPLPAVLRHRMMRTFDVHDITDSIERAIGQALAGHVDH
jgi:hypothetical protein